jgi:hypothetical protein
MNELIAMIPLKELLLQFLGIVVLIAAIAALIYVVETYVIKESLPNAVKMFIGLVLIILVIIWGINLFG